MRRAFFQITLAALFASGLPGRIPSRHPVLSDIAVDSVRPWGEPESPARIWAIPSGRAVVLRTEPRPAESRLWRASIPIAAAVSGRSEAVRVPVARGVGRRGSGALYSVQPAAAAIWVSRFWSAVAQLRPVASTFSYHEAFLLDQGRFEEWLGLFAPHGHYWMPLEPGQTDPHLVTSLLYEDLFMLRLRITQGV